MYLCSYDHILKSESEQQGLVVGMLAGVVVTSTTPSPNKVNSQYKGYTAHAEHSYTKACKHG